MINIYNILTEVEIVKDDTNVLDKRAQMANPK